MKSKDVSGRTKNQLAQALSRMLEEKTLDKITIKMLTEECGIRRQSFYYHFDDIYQLFDWMLERKREELLGREELFLDGDTMAKDILYCIGQEETFFACVARNMGEEQFEDYIKSILYVPMEKSLTYYKEVYRLPELEAEEEDLTSMVSVLAIMVRRKLLEKDLFNSLNRAEKRAENPIPTMHDVMLRRLANEQNPV